jgi:outer membrane lipoprotein-sorting protein
MEFCKIIGGYMKKLFLIQAILFALITINTNYSQTVNEIIKKHFEAVNQDQFTNLKSIVVTSELVIPGGKAPSKTYFKFPDKIRIEVTQDGKTTITAYDGKTAWRLSPDENDGKAYELGKESTNEDQLMSILDGYFFCYKQRSNNVSLMGTEKLLGKDNYKIKCKSSPDDSSYIYLDTNTYLISKIQKPVKDKFNETYLSDYRKTGNNMIFPFTFNINTPFSRTFQLIKDIKVNADLNDSLFTMPGQQTETKGNK